MKKFDFIYLIGVIGIICVFVVWGMNLITSTLSIAFLMLCAASGRFSVDGKLFWPVHLLLAGAIALLTLNVLYNPSKNVFTNVDHHILSFEGYESSGDTVCVIGNNSDQPIWDGKNLGGSFKFIRTNNHVSIDYTLSQPIYQKVSATIDSLVNGNDLPFFDEKFTLFFNSGGLALSVEVKDSIRPDRFMEVVANKFSPMKKGYCSVYVTFKKNNLVLGRFQGSHQQFIRKSLSLYDIISDIPFPEDFNIETDVFKGITLLRSVSGAKIESTTPSHFYLSFSPIALSQIRSVKTNKCTYSRDKLVSRGSLAVKDGVAYKIGTGLYSTPYIYPQLHENKLSVMLDVPLRHTLPMDKDSIDKIHTAIITSNYKSLASAPTSLALNYPVFSQLDEAKQFYLAIEYLPEETMVPLSCKIVPISDDRLTFFSPKKGDILTDGDIFTLNNNYRNLSPVFRFINLRENVPFSSTKGYLLIIAALFGAFLSMLIGGRRYEVRGETVVWLFLIALLVFRSFLAWRASVFPPLDNFSIASFESYIQDKYTFGYTLYGIIGLTAILIAYKLCRDLFVKRPSMTAWIVSVSISVIVVLGMFINERVRAVYAPVVCFFLIEWLFIQLVPKDNFKMRVFRYVSMFLLSAYTLIMDSGFGIVFSLFILLYNAFDNYLKWPNLKGKEKLRSVLFFVMLVVMFVFIMFFGIYIVPFIYQHFVISCIVLTCLLFGAASTYRRKVPDTMSAYWKWIPILVMVSIPFIFAIKGKSYLDNHRHLLYRSEIHIKPVDEIIKDEKVNTRDLERLFQASQNRWYLNYYTQEMPNLNDAPYELRSHFNKGITWHTQKTDAVLGRYVIGEHSVWAAYALILVFFVLLPTIFSSTETTRQLLHQKLLGIGACSLLLCQAIFIFLAVTNRFIFFGQDYPLVSMDSALTILLTFSLLIIIALSTLSTFSKEYYQKRKVYLFDKKPMIVLCVLFILTLMPGRTLYSKSDKAFNVGEAIRDAKAELSFVNDLMSNYQSVHGRELKKTGIINSSNEIQHNYATFINSFDKEYSVGDTLLAMSERPNSGVSRFSTSLYLLYRDQLSKNNSSSDIIHLRKQSDGHLELNINNGYYQLTTPESNLESWQGNIVPEKVKSGYSVLSLQRELSLEQLVIEGKSARIDNLPDISYDYPLYFAKIDNEWVLGGNDFYIVGREYQDVILKSGVKQFAFSDASQASHYMCARTGDLVETRSHDGKTNGIFIKGEQNRYFARNMLVNGKRSMIYPLESKFFFPYQMTQMVNKALSGKDDKKRKRDVVLSLSYPLTEQLFDDLNMFDDSQTTNARSIIVADGDGYIRAFVSAKNEKRPSGYIYVNPNDQDVVLNYQNRFYLTGDILGEQRAFGDLNMTYLNPGPGSSMKPITFTAVASQVYADWRDFALYVNPQDQSLSVISAKNYIATKRYAGKSLPFESLYSDEIGENGLTNIRRYIQKSSNYYNSLMVYLGYYDSEYISKEFEKVVRNKHSELFKPYSSTDTLTNFPAFKIGSRYYSFRHWLTDDGMPRHENGALHIGFKNNFHLWKDKPTTLFDKDITESVDIYSDKDLPDSLRINYSYAYPAISYLPEHERITKEGINLSIRNTTLGASPFHVTPLKMAEMYGKLFSQNRMFRLTLNPHYKNEYAPFVIDRGYSGGLYEDILSNHLMEGMAAVTKIGGTAGDSGDKRRLTAFTEEMKAKGYYIYAKTGTIGNAMLKTNNQLLAVVITKGAFHGQSKNDFNKLTKTHKFYVAYFVTENSYHDYSVIRNALNTIVNSNAFINYMNKDNE